MVEALNLFGSIVKNAYFEKKPIMLFLNKKDIFAEKIQFSDIQKVPHFSDYGGPRKDFDYGVLYFIQKFEEEMGEEFQDNFIHVTNATDTSNMEFVLHASKMIIMQHVRPSYLFKLPIIFDDFEISFTLTEILFSWLYFVILLFHFETEFCKSISHVIYIWVCVSVCIKKW